MRNSVGGGPMLWRSPIWMPFAWEIVAVQFGSVGLWLWNRFCGWGLVGILGEFGIAILLAILARRVSQGNSATAFVACAAGGLGIFICYALAYTLTDRVMSP